jgi:hypothetical protein
MLPTVLPIVRIRPIILRKNQWVDVKRQKGSIYRYYNPKQDHYGEVDSTVVKTDHNVLGAGVGRLGRKFRLCRWFHGDQFKLFTRL